GVRSLAAFPVWGQSHWYGFICVEDLENDREWSASEKTFLQTVRAPAPARARAPGGSNAGRAALLSK
ncbi:GAF domain-containing protein, partial [Parapusillimonas granuli]